MRPVFLLRFLLLRSLSAFALSIALCAFADAATVHHPRPPERRFHPPQPSTALPKGYAVPGWTDEETREWLNGASGPKG
jgi:hypothetical protein